jgi:hypothetical protein
VSNNCGALQKVVVGSKSREDVTQADRDEIMRKAIRAALKDCGYLKEGRGSYSTTFPQESGKHT